MPGDFIFDTKAAGYDQDFSDTYTGKIQRTGIHHFIRQVLGEKKDLEILEINCGTGEDAIFLSNFGKVTATDVSEKMLEQASQKNIGKNIQWEVWDLHKPFDTEKKYDLIFSNFGGLNCISPERLTALNDEFFSLLKSRGEMYLVFMHRWSLVEFLYFLTRFNVKKAFRRLNKKADFYGLMIHYYSRKELKNIFSSFLLHDELATGVLLSGAYMNKPGRFLKIKEKKVQWLKPFLGADHIVYGWKKK